MNHFEKTAMQFLTLLMVILAGCGGDLRHNTSQNEHVTRLSNPNRNASTLENYIQGEIAYENGNLPLALSLFDAAWRADDDPFLALRLAAVYYETGEETQAEKRVEEVLKNNRKNVSAWLTRAKGRFRLGDHQGARVAAHKVMQLAPNHTDGAIFYAMLLEKQGKAEAAIGILRRTLQYRKGHLSTSLALCQILLKQGAFDKAHAIAQSIRPQSRIPADLLMDLGKKAHSIGRNEAAAALFEQAFDNRPPTRKERLELIDIYLSGGNLTQACAQLYTLSQPDTVSVSPYLEVAGRWVRAQHLFEARNVLLSGLKQLPNDPVLILYLAAVEIQLTRLEDAALLLEKESDQWNEDALACARTLHLAINEWPTRPADCSLFQNRLHP